MRVHNVYMSLHLAQVCDHRDAVQRIGQPVAIWPPHGSAATQRKHISVRISLSLTSLPHSLTRGIPVAPWVDSPVIRVDIRTLDTDNHIDNI